jgi:hypothetical protein
MSEEVGICGKIRNVRQASMALSGRGDGSLAIKMSCPAHSRPDAFILFGLVPTSIETQNDDVGDRIDALRAFQSDIERFAFLLDLRDSNPSLFDAVCRRDNTMMLMFVKFVEFNLLTTD